MKQEHETLPLQDLIEVLNTLCEERRTGTMFIHTDTNRSARIGIEQGRIFFVAFGRYRGLDAIEHIKTMQYGKFSFAESIFNSGAEIPLPPTGELLAQLAWAAAGEPDGMGAVTDPFPAWNGAAPTKSAALAMPLVAPPPPVLFANVPLPGSAEDMASAEVELRLTGERLYDAVAEALALAIGPVASMVCDDYRDRLLAVATPEEFRALATEIAAEAGEPKDAARFLSRALAAGVRQRT
jgi:hypothetical protein